MHARAARLRHWSPSRAGSLRIVLPLAFPLAGVLAVALCQPGYAEPLRVDNPAAKEKKIYPEIEEARQKLMKQDIDGALESLNAAAKAHPDLASGRAQLANIYFSANRPREGRVQLEKAVVESPDDAEPYLMMADLALREGRWTEAELLSAKAIALSQAFKGDADRKKDMQKRAYLGAAMAAQAHEQWEESRKLLTALLKVAPDTAAAHFRLGQVLFELDKTKEAFAELQAAARMDEDIPSPEATMGQLFDKNKDRANAEKWMKQAVDADPKRLKTRLQVAQWLMAIGKTDDAKAQMEEALKIDPASQESLLLAGRIARFAKDFPQAQKYLERSYLESPGAVNVANELALTLVEMGEDARQRALTLAEATYRQTREPEAAATLGWVCFRLGRKDDAERLLNSVVSGNNQVTPDAIYFVATLAEDRNRGDAAKPLLEAALKSDAPFAYRQDAQKLYDRLAKSGGGTKIPARPAAKPAAVKAADGEDDSATASDSGKPAATKPVVKPATPKPPAVKPAAP